MVLLSDGCLASIPILYVINSARLVILVYRSFANWTLLAGHLVISSRASLSNKEVIEHLLFISSRCLPFLTLHVVFC